MDSVVRLAKVLFLNIHRDDLEFFVAGKFLRDCFFECLGVGIP